MKKAFPCLLAIGIFGMIGISVFGGATSVTDIPQIDGAQRAKLQEVIAALPTGGSGGNGNVSISNSQTYVAFTTQTVAKVSFTETFILPVTTTPSNGVFTLNGTRYFHNYGSVSNTFMGFNAGNMTMTGSALRNDGFGDNTLMSLTSGSDNTAGGSRALQNLTTAGSCTAFGSVALGSDTIASQNSAFGAGALQSTVSGDEDCGGGYQSLAALTGTRSTAWGNSSGRSAVASDGITMLGYGAGFTGTSGNLTNSTAIGFQSTVTASHTMTLGGTNPGVSTVSVAIGRTSAGAKFDVNGNFKLGASGTSVSNLISATASLDFGNIAPGVTSNLSITVTGAKLGDAVTLGLPYTFDPQLSPKAYATNDLVVIYLRNPTGETVTVTNAAATYRALVHSF